MGDLWRNWSGSIAFDPQQHARPRSVDELCALVAAAHARGGSVRVVGTGHSSTPIVRGDDVLVSLEHLDGVVSTDRHRREAVVRAGSTLEELGEALYGDDLALPNYGDVATQTIGGAVGTGTHGTGRHLQNMSQMLVGATFVTATGELRSVDAAEPDLLSAARVALGTLGIFTELRLKLVPAFDVDRREYATTTAAALDHLDELVGGNHSFDFYWYPRRDDIKLRLVNPVGGGTAVLPYARELVRQAGYSHQLIPTHSGIPHRFEESEYAVPAEQGPDCFRAVRQRVLQRWRHVVGWRVLYRTVAADDAWLSPAHGRDTVTISLHQNSTLPWREFFDDVEPIFRAHGGRPHWAKKHTLVADGLAPLYPEWAAFARVRESLDPRGTFLTPYLRELLGVPAP